MRSLLERQRISNEAVGTLDAIAVAAEETDANAQVFQVRDGVLADRHDRRMLLVINIIITLVLGAMASQLRVQAGFTKIVNLKGGIADLQAAGATIVAG